MRSSAFLPMASGATGGTQTITLQFRFDNLVDRARHVIWRPPRVRVGFWILIYCTTAVAAAGNERLTK